MALNVGTRLIGKYTITKVIGEGGFGVVYIAKEELSGKMVAIKEYFPVQVCKRSADGKVFLKMKDEFHQTMYYKGRARFTNEAKSLYEMEHEHIVKVYEYFEENNTAYMVMDYIRGISLKQFLKKNTKLNSAQAEGILQPLIGAIEYLHNFKGGIIHRDIAPDNIIIDMAKGVPILIDFGTTMGLDDSGATAFAKPYYSPIEQSSEGLTDLQGFHTDLYSLAATFYHCLTGSKPEDATARMLNSDEVNLSKTLAEEFDPKLLKLVDLGLIVRPEQRPQSVQKWLELAGYREAPSTNIPTPDTGEEQEHAGDGKTKASRTEPKKSKAPMAFVLLLLVAIGSGAGYYFMPPTTPSVVRVGFELVPASTELKINGKVINSNSTYSIVAGRNYGVSLSAEDYQETSFSVMLNDKGVPIFVPSAGVNALALKSYSDSKGFNMQLRRKKLPLLLETDVSNVDFRVSKLDGDREKTKVPYQAEMELETGEYVIAAVNLDNGQRIEKTVILSDSSPSVPQDLFGILLK
jgi:serine/threonine protein kinase